MGQHSKDPKEKVLSKLILAGHRILTNRHLSEAELHALEELEYAGCVEVSEEKINEEGYKMHELSLTPKGKKLAKRMMLRA